MREERELIRLTKWMILLMIVLIITTFFSCDAKAAVITGERHLLGMPVYLEKLDKPLYPESIELLAQVMFHENYCNGETVMYYTGAVVMNRVRSKRWPNTVKAVLYQRNPIQYSTTGKFFTKEIPNSVYRLACKVAKGTPDVPENVVYQAMFPQGAGVWKKEPSSYAPTKDFEYFCYGK